MDIIQINIAIGFKAHFIKAFPAQIQIILFRPVNLHCLAHGTELYGQFAAGSSLSAVKRTCPSWVVRPPMRCPLSEQGFLRSVKELAAAISLHPLPFVTFRPRFPACKLVIVNRVVGVIPVSPDRVTIGVRAQRIRDAGEESSPVAFRQSRRSVQNLPSHPCKGIGQ